MQAFMKDKDKLIINTQLTEEEQEQIKEFLDEMEESVETKMITAEPLYDINGEKGGIQVQLQNIGNAFTQLDVKSTDERQEYIGRFSRVNVNPPDMEEVTVSNLSFAESNTFNIMKNANTFINKVVIEKDVNLNPENIVENIEIAGIVGNRVPFKGDIQATVSVNYEEFPLLYNASFIQYLDKITDISGFENITSFNNFFSQAIRLKEVPNLDYSNALYAYNMFQNCKSLKTVSNLNMPLIQSSTYMFYNCSNLTEVKDLNMPNLAYLGGMFYNCSNLASVTNIVTNNQAFASFNTTFTNSGIERFNLLEAFPGVNLSRCNNMYGAFENCINLIEADFTGMIAWDMFNADSVFNNCTNLTKITNFSVQGTNSNQYTRYYFFNLCMNCTNLREVDMHFPINQGTSSVKYLFTNAFRECTNLTDLHFEYKVSTNNIYSFSSAFLNCFNLTNISGLDFSGSQNATVISYGTINYMFNSCRKLERVYISGLRTNQNLTNFPNITKDSINFMISNLYKYTAGSNSRTFTLGETLIAKFNTEELEELTEIANSRGWILE